MRVLHLSPELPYAPGGTGGSTRQFHLLRELVGRGHQVTCVAPVHADQREGAERLRTAGVRLLAVDRPASRVREVLDAVRRRPGLMARALGEPLLAWQVDVFWTALRDRVAEALATEAPDVLVVEHDWAAGWRGDLPPGIPVVLVLHNVTSTYFRSRSAAAAGWRAAALGLEGSRFATHDRRWLRAYDGLVAVSEEDRAAAAALAPAVPCAVVPNGVDTARFVPAADPGGPTCLYTGTMSYPPNAEGLRWLLDSIWPLVREREPDATLTVLGRGAPADLVARADPGVTFTGWVDEVSPYFAQAAVVLVPVRSGGGTRLKVLDALSTGRPIVTTRVGAEGIAVADGEQVVFADTPEAFAAATVGLLGDPSRRAAMGAAGRALAEARYDWSSLGEAFETALLRARDVGSRR